MERPDVRMLSNMGKRKDTSIPSCSRLGATWYEFGEGFDGESSLLGMRQFFKTFPNTASLWHELSTVKI